MIIISYLLKKKLKMNIDVIVYIINTDNNWIRNTIQHVIDRLWLTY